MGRNGLLLGFCWALGCATQAAGADAGDGGASSGATTGGNASGQTSGGSTSSGSPGCAGLGLACALADGGNGVCYQGSCVFAGCLGAPAGGPCYADGGLGVCCGGGCLARGVANADPQNCGGCGVVCPQGASCRSGQCLAATGGGPASCTGNCPSGDECLTSVCLQQRCGALDDGKTCFDSARPTSVGRCCHGSCVDKDNDSNNCYACGNACSSDRFCSQSGCFSTPDCTVAGQVDCPLAGGGTGVCCEGGCVDPQIWQADSYNCGECGAICPYGSSCSGGKCSAQGCTPRDCSVRTSCLGNVCIFDACGSADEGRLCDLSGGMGSAAQGFCCGGACTDVSADPANCGACSLACGAAQTCQLGRCG